MSLQQIKVAREEILSIVKENKKKHDDILKDSIEGYWLEAEKTLKRYEKDTLYHAEKNHKEQLKKMRKSLRDKKKEVREQVKKELEFVEKRKKDAAFVYMRNKYPENHSDDYIGTIRRLELCVDKEVELDVVEFDKYVRNKWEWRDSFITSNSGYVTSLWGASYAGTGSCADLYGNGLAVTDSWCSGSIALNSF